MPKKKALLGIDVPEITVNDIVPADNWSRAVHADSTRELDRLFEEARTPGKDPEPADRAQLARGQAKLARVSGK
jgi:hypothetical protein